jgi:hypothetical protein
VGVGGRRAFSELWLTEAQPGDPLRLDPDWTGARALEGGVRPPPCQGPRPPGWWLAGRDPGKRLQAGLASGAPAGLSATPGGAGGHQRRGLADSASQRSAAASHAPGRAALRDPEGPCGTLATAPRPRTVPLRWLQGQERLDPR